MVFSEIWQAEREAIMRQVATARAMKQLHDDGYSYRAIGTAFECSHEQARRFVTWLVTLEERGMLDTGKEDNAHQENV